MCYTDNDFNETNYMNEFMTCESPLQLLLVEDDRHFARWAAAEMHLYCPEWQVTVTHDLAQARAWLASPAAQGLSLAVIDLHLGLDSGVELIAELTAGRPDVPILVMTSVQTADDALNAIRAGAQGYLLKNAVDGEFSRGVLELHQGASPINPGIAHLLVSAFRTSDALARAAQVVPDLAPQELLATLSPRETEVLRQLARGYSDKEIAAQLRIAPSTVDTHVRGIYRKFQVNSRVQLRRLLRA